MKLRARAAVSILASLSLVPGLTLLAGDASADQGPSTRSASAAGPVAAEAPARKLHWTPRPEQYPETVTTTDLAITMDDGVVLRADLVRPARADGSVVSKPLPVIITITAYNKTVLATGGLGGPSADYLVKRGYAQLTVDARGTGSSEGIWEAFSPRETRDYGAVVAWAHRQPWSNGKSGMTGPSYMGIAQIFAAAAHPPGLKAIFPQVPGADVYRDIVASGGKLIQPFHPFTRESQQSVPAGTVVPVDVEVFPTGAAIRPGHRLRLSIQGFDVPHLLPTVPNIAQIAPLTVYASDVYPSVLTIPVRTSP